MFILTLLGHGPSRLVCNMLWATDVLCICCNMYIPRSQERAHRAKLMVPYTGSACRTSKLLRVVDVESDNESNNLPLSLNGDIPVGSDDSRADLSGGASFHVQTEKQANTKHSALSSRRSGRNPAT